jgi:hypothetical protein
MAQYRVLASEGRQRYIYTKTHKNIKEKKNFTQVTKQSTNLLPFFSQLLRGGDQPVLGFLLLSGSSAGPAVDPARPPLPVREQ